VQRLADEIGVRSTNQPRKMVDGATYIKDQLTAAGYTNIANRSSKRGARTPNMEAMLKGTSKRGGDHRDWCPLRLLRRNARADDNASGVAAGLALARRFAGKPQSRTVRFVFFVNEEPPAFWTNDMGSRVYAANAAKRTTTSQR